MKRKLLATLLALCLIVGMIPVAASAEDGDVAQVGNNTYATLGEAVSNASSGETIIMIADTDISDTGLIVPEKKSLILDINGKKIEASNVPSKNIVVYGDLTIRDSAENSTGKIFTESTYPSGGTTALITAFGEDASITLESGFIDAASSFVGNEGANGQFGLGVLEGGDITIKGGTVEAGWYAISGNGTNATQNSVINIQGGELVSTADYAIYLPQSGETTITGGTIYGAAGGISIQRGTLDISGDALITSKGTGDTGDWGDGTGGQDSAALNIAAKYGDCTVSISGGKLTAVENALIIEGDTEYESALSITGGTFSSDVSEYVADGYTMVESDDEYVVEPLGPGNSVAQVGENYFDSLEDAISKAESGDTVVLLKSTTGNGNIDISDGREITLNLNGFDVGFAQNGKINLTHGILNLMGRGMLYEEKPYYAPVMLYGAETDQADYTAITVGEDVILQGWSGLFVDYNKAQKAYGVKATVYGTLNSVRDYTGAGGHAFYINGTIKDTEGNVPEFILDGATLNTEDGNGMYLAGYAKTTITDSTIISNSEDSTGIEIRAGELEITNSTIIGGNGEYTGAPNGNGSTSFNVALAVTQHTTKLPIKITVNSGTFSANAAFVQANPQKNGQEDIDKVTLEINGGDFNGLVYSENKTRFISGGNFTSDPSEYLADDLAAVPSDVAGYAFTVGQAADTDVAPAVGSPNVELGEEIKENDRDAVTDVAESVKVNGGELTAAANSVLEQVTGEQITAAESAIRADGSGVAVGDDDTVTVYAQTYLDITPTSYDSEDGTLTMDITPMYRVVATTADSADDIKVIGETEDTPNAVVLDGSEEELDIQTMTITLTLPTDFVYANGTVYIQHKGYEYSATANARSEITFTNPHGFSEFTFTTDSQAVATIGSTSYTSLQAAVDDATSDDIIVVKNGNVDLSATANKTVKVMNGTENNINVTINGVSRTIGENETETFVYTSGGGGTPSEPEEPTWPFEDVTEGKDWFYDAVAYVYENGIMAGTDETTFEPYMELDRAMAAQLFYNLEGKPTVTGDSTFTDVTSGHWAVDAITWAAQNDIVAGIGGGLYDPDSNVTREQFAVMLYKYARFKGYDLTATGDLTQFPDAGSISSWAETALSWANGKGLINGHENGTIDPKGSTIRAQAASIMANFDQNVAK